MSTKDMVMFEMADGTKISNDPRFDLDKALADSLNSQPTRGSVGPTWDEQNAQVLAEKQAALNSTQPGVGSNATVDDPTAEAHGTLGPPAWRSDPEAAKAAEAAGGSPANTTNDDPEPEDSNARVAAVREQVAKDREAYAKAVDKLGDEGPGNPEEPFSEWSAKQLVAEIHRRNSDESRDEADRIVLEKQTKGNAVEALDADNKRIADAAAGQGTQD